MNRDFSRRRFLQGVGMVGAAAVGSQLLTTPRAFASPTSSLFPVGVLDTWVNAPNSWTAAMRPRRAYRAWRVSPDGTANAAGLPVAVLDRWVALAYAPQRETHAKAAYRAWRAATTARPLSPLTTQGFYAYATDFLPLRQVIKASGATTMRISNTQMTAEACTALIEDGYDVHVTFTGARRETFGDESAWIAAYLAALDTWMGLYGSCVRAIEVWNEPNFGMWTNASNAQKQLAYGHLLVAAYQHIKAQWPDKTVVGFGAGGASDAAPGFIKGVFAQTPAAANAFDVAAIHPYPGAVAPDATIRQAWGSWTIRDEVASVRALTNKPLWFTEVGWQISHADGGRFTTDPGSCVTPAQQADYRTRLFLLCLELGIQRLHHMYVIDTDNYNGGFWTVNQIERPSVAAFRQQQAALPTPTAAVKTATGYDVTTANGVVHVDTSGATVTYVPG